MMWARSHPASSAQAALPQASTAESAPQADGRLRRRARTRGRCRFGSRGAAKALTIGPRGHSQRGDEAAAERLGRAESAAPGDLTEGKIRLLELAPRGIQAQMPHVVTGRHSDSVDKMPGEAALALREPFRKARHREILIQVLEHPQLQLAQPRVLAELCCEMVTELRLPSG